MEVIKNLSDAELIGSLKQGRSMDAALKTQLTTAVTRAADFPGLLPSVLERIKSAIGG